MCICLSVGVLHFATVMLYHLVCLTGITVLSTRIQSCIPNYGHTQLLFSFHYFKKRAIIIADSTSVTTMISALHILCNESFTRHYTINTLCGLRCCQILSDTVRYCQIVSDTVRCCQIMSDALRYCQMLEDTVRCCQILSDTLSIFI